jgi:hypothetical protein
MFRARFASLFRRLRDKPLPEPIVGLAWYSADQWDLLRQVSADVDRLEKTHAEWLRAAEAKHAELAKKGTHVVKVPMDVADMARWCHEMGRKTVDAEGRALYVTFRLQQPKTVNFRKLT